MIRLNHLALVCRSEENADRFFIELLGLEKRRSRDLAPDLARALFLRDQPFRFIEYGGEGAVFEIFIDPGAAPLQAEVAHACLETPDLPGFLDRVRAMGLEVREVDKDGKTVVFILDFDGHPYEIKPGP